MKIYQDRGLTEEINLLDLGIAPAGEIKQFTFYVYNELDAYLVDLEFEIDHERNEVFIIDAPKELPAKGSSELIIEWRPSITLKEGLRARIYIKGKELWS